ncbi:hypothetical protein GCM10009565_48480 [Amycolatopsis albidoflavus]
MVDTGVDVTTPQLVNAHVLPGVDLTSPSRGPANTDCYGHGTFNAGIIAATPAPGTGFLGLAPDVTILPIRCATTDTPNVAGSLTAEGMANGIRQAVDSGARVINISASTTTPVPDLAAAVEYASRRDVVVVASAANTAQQGNPVTYPASYPSVIAVGAVDKDGKHADFSQTGPFVSLVAPGVAITSIGPGGPGQWQGNGTSYAAPFVAATVALIRAYRPRLTAPQIKHRLEVTADHPAAALPDPALGWGTLNVTSAVTDELPEESGAAAIVVRPHGAHPADLAAPDGLGPVLAVASAVGVLVVVLALLVISRLFGEGSRRGWRRARVAKVRSAEPVPGSARTMRKPPAIQ